MLVGIGSQCSTAVQHNTGHFERGSSTECSQWENQHCTWFVEGSISICGHMLWRACSYARAFATTAADDLWMHLEAVGVERSAVGTRGGHPVFGRVEDKLKHMITKRCGLRAARCELCTSQVLAI